jgi:hypothetical protein
VQERVFIKHMAATNDKTYAATKAGYSQPVARGLEKSKALANEVRAEQIRRLESEGLPLAVDVHLALLRDKATPAGAKVSAVKLMYDATFLRPDGDAGAKEPHEMTADELSERIAQMQREKAARAKPVQEIEGTVIEPDSSVFE